MQLKLDVFFAWPELRNDLPPRCVRFFFGRLMVMFTPIGYAIQAIGALRLSKESTEVTHQIVLGAICARVHVLVIPTFSGIKHTKVNLWMSGFPTGRATCMGARAITSGELIKRYCAWCVTDSMWGS